HPQPERDGLAGGSVVCPIRRAGAAWPGGGGLDDVSGGLCPGSGLRHPAGAGPDDGAGGQAAVPPEKKTLGERRRRNERGLTLYPYSTASPRLLKKSRPADMCGWTGHIQGNLPLRVCEAARPSAWFSGKFCPQGDIRGKEFLSCAAGRNGFPLKYSFTLGSP